MNPFMPHGYGSFPAVQFGFPDQRANAYRRFAPRYSAQGFNPPLFNSMPAYPAMGMNKIKPYTIAEQLLSAYNNLDDQYRYEQYMKQVNAMRMQNLTTTTDVGEIYNVIRETRYVPYPVVFNQGGGSLSGLSGFGGGNTSLLPKVRVIFMPTGQSFLQQPCAGPLSMPPFLYNRISQPFYSFPLPPPLPQLGSLPLTPNVQQMVMERYSNPVAVLPFAPNWQMPQMMSGWSQIPQQPFVNPVSAFQSYPTAPQSYYCPQPPPIPSYPPAPHCYVPPPPPPSFPSYPPVPLSCLPAPVPAGPSFLPTPQSQIPPPPIVPANSYMPSPPQSFIPPPPNISASSYITPPPPPPPPPPSTCQQPFANTHNASSAPQYPYNGHPGACRACPPAPPSLNLSVTGHCWVQHCAACHHVPTPVSNPNTRPYGGRITPLLRHPTVPQYIPDQTVPQQQQQYYQANAPVMMRPWLRKTPPLPPGAVLISDEVFDRNGFRSRYSHSQRKHGKYSRSSGSRRRSKTIESSATSLSSVKNTKNSRHRHSNQNYNNLKQQPEVIKPKDSKELSQLSTSSSGLSFEYQKTAIQQQPGLKKGNIPPQVANEARNVNLQYNYRPQELSSVYLINRFLKSSSETTSLSSKRDTASNCSSSLAKTRSQTSLSSTDLSSIQEESHVRFDNQQLTLPSPSFTKPKDKTVVIRQFMTSSPSTLSTISSNMSFSVIDKDIDSVSMTSTIRGNKLDEEDLLESEIF